MSVQDRGAGVGQGEGRVWLEISLKTLQPFLSPLGVGLWTVRTPVGHTVGGAQPGREGTLATGGMVGAGGWGGSLLLGSDPRYHSL